MRAFIGLGSNLSQPLEQIQSALRALQSLPQSRFVRASSCYRSPALTHPDDVRPQPDYCNAVAELDTQLPAADLLRALHEIERQHGRQRLGTRWQARTLDLDLLLYGQQQIDEAGLRVPHPEIHKRDFVLQPWREIAPQVKIPGQGQVSELCAALNSAELPCWLGEEK